MKRIWDNKLQQDPHPFYVIPFIEDAVVDKLDCTQGIVWRVIPPSFSFVTRFPQRFTTLSGSSWYGELPVGNSFFASVLQDCGSSLCCCGHYCSWKCHSGTPSSGTTPQKIPDQCAKHWCSRSVLAVAFLNTIQEQISHRMGHGWRIC